MSMKTQNLSSCEECDGFRDTREYFWECECGAHSQYTHTHLDIVMQNAKRHSKSKEHLVDIFEVAPFYLACSKIYVDSIKPNT